MEINDGLDERVESYQTKADKVVDQAHSLLSNIFNAEYELHQIAKINSSLVGISKQDVEYLEKKFKDIFENNSVLENLDASLAFLTESNERNQHTLRLFEREIPSLKSQVNELNRIQFNLDTKCDLKRNKLKY